MWLIVTHQTLDLQESKPIFRFFFFFKYFWISIYVVVETCTFGTLVVSPAGLSAGTVGRYGSQELIPEVAPKAIFDWLWPKLHDSTTRGSGCWCWQRRTLNVWFHMQLSWSFVEFPVNLCKSPWTFFSRDSCTNFHVRTKVDLQFSWNSDPHPVQCLFGLSQV